jgi:6-phosphogluconolactonase
MLGVSSLIQGQTSKNMQYNLLIGTYSSKDKNNGIYVYQFNAQTGEFGQRSNAADIKNPSYLAISRDGKQVYSVSEAGAGKGGVSAYSFNPSSGELKFINSVSSGGDGPCYVSVDGQNKFVFVGNYSGGSLSAIRINQDGSLNADIQTIQHEGSGVNKDRQEKPHVHSTVLSPDDRYLLVPDLGTDRVNIYSVDVTKSKPLKPAEPPFASVKPGSGPRHLTFHPNGKFAYLIQEMEGLITAFDYHKGKLESKQSITMLSSGFTGEVGAADIHVSPDGHFLYGSNRGDANEIVIYAIDKDGKLSYAGRQSTMGKTPRNFAIDPTGNFLLAANQNSDEVIIFKRDQKTGLLTSTGKKIAVTKPVCLKFAAVK